MLRLIPVIFAALVGVTATPALAQQCGAVALTSTDQAALQSDADCYAAQATLDQSGVADAQAKIAANNAQLTQDQATASANTGQAAVLQKQIDAISATNAALLANDATLSSANASLSATISNANSDATASLAAQKARLDRIAFLKLNDNPLTGVALGQGAAAIPTLDHDVMDDIKKAGIPGTAAPDVLGAFRFICRHTATLYDDHVVFYQQPGKSHLHDGTGPYDWNAYSNYGNLRRSGGSGCNDVAANDHDLTKQTHAANRTPYEQPALLDGKGNYIVADYTSFYYKRRPLTDPVCSDPTNKQYQGKCVPLPAGLKFRFGADLGKKTKTNFAYQCVASSGTPIGGNTMFAAAVQCAKDNFAAGARLEVHQDAPSCWNGKDLDTPDHVSHLAYAGYGSWGYLKCPAGYPFVIPSFTYAAFYRIAPTDTGDIHWSSDDMDPTQPRGWSFHADYGPMAWAPEIYAMWEANCLDKLLNCSGGNLGNGYMLKDADVPTYLVNGKWAQSWTNPVRLIPLSSVPQTMVMP